MTNPQSNLLDDANQLGVQRLRLIRRHLHNKTATALKRHTHDDPAAFLSDLKRPIASPGLHRSHVLNLFHVSLRAHDAPPHLTRAAKRTHTPCLRGTSYRERRGITRPARQPLHKLLDNLTKNKGTHSCRHPTRETFHERHSRASKPQRFAPLHHASRPTITNGTHRNIRPTSKWPTDFLNHHPTSTIVGASREVKTLHHHDVIKKHRAKLRAGREPSTNTRPITMPPHRRQRHRMRHHITHPIERIHHR